MKFSELELRPTLQTAIDGLGFSECTAVQAATIPHILDGRDVAGLAQTGTGKTAAFLLPLMERILCAQVPQEGLSETDKALMQKRAFPDWRSNQFVLVLVPTRELADQVYENAKQLAGISGLRAVSIYGGVAYEKQKSGLRDGFEFVIATPGRLIDLYKEHQCDLKQVRAIVFDEADRMFDMGFKDDMKFILQRVPKERQFLVFSATLNMDVMSTAYQFGANPVDVDVSRDQTKAENVDDKIFHVSQEEKGMYLLSLVKLHKPRQAIIFSNFKMNVPRISQFLNDNGVPAVGISSLLTQSQRTRVMEQFRSDTNDRNILVATDVAARGLDIKGVDMVINFELPDDAENYVHRIGRTGRAGAKGLAFSLVSDRDVDALGRVEEYLRHKVEASWLEDAEMVKDYVAMPMHGGHGSSHSGGGPSGRAQSGSSGSQSRPGDRRPRSQKPMSGRPERGEARQDGNSNRRPPQGDRNNRDGGRPPRSAGGAPSQSNSRDSRYGQANRNGGNGPSSGSGPAQRGRTIANGPRGGPQHGSGPQQGARSVNGKPYRTQGKNDSRPSVNNGRNQTRKPIGTQAHPVSFGSRVSGFFKRLFGG